MRSLIFICIAISLFAVEIKVQTALESSGNKYAILAISAPDAFSCVQLEEYSKPINKYQCNFKALPDRQIEPIEDSWFKIRPQIQNGNFSVIIEPKKTSKMILQNFDAKNNTPIQVSASIFSKEFLIIAYDKNLPFLNLSGGGLNFPISLKTNAFPYVKNLDVNGLPITDNASLDDMKEYMSIKKEIDKKSYADALKSIEKAEKYHPNSIFFSDFEYLRLQALMGLNTPEGWLATVNSAKDWLKNYANDEKTPEVLLLLANAYSAMADSKNAEYYYKRVIDDYAHLEVSKRAMIGLGDMYHKAQKYRNALEWYRKALFATKDIQIASLAAYKAAETYLTLKEPAGAREYAIKLLKGNMSFILQDKQKAFDFATKLGNAGLYPEAIALGFGLLKNLNKEDENYPKILYLLGLWSEKNNDLDEARGYYTAYLEEFPKGYDHKEAQNSLDAIVFGQTSQDDAKALDVYNQTIEKYKNEDIGKKALAQKAQLLYKTGQCENILSDETQIAKLPKDLLPNASEIILDCKNKVAFANIDKKECKAAFAIIDANKLTPPPSQNLFDCYIEQNRFKQAVSLAYNQAKKGGGKDRLTWLANYEKALLTQEDYKIAVLVATDTIKLANALNITGFDYLWIDKFNAAYKLSDLKTMTESIEQIEKIYGNSPLSIAPYKDMAMYALKKNDDITVQKYTRKIIDVQNRLNVKTETPWAQFTLAESLAKTNDIQGALNILNTLNTAKLTPESSARKLYMSANYLLRLGQKQTALDNLKACAAIKDGGAWVKLCQNGLDINR